MAKEIYEKVRNPKTAEDWDAQAKYLKQQLAAARKAQKNAEKQERLQREEEERNQQLAEALELIEFMKGFKLNNGASVYDWMHAKFAEAKAFHGTMPTGIRYRILFSQWNKRIQVSISPLPQIRAGYPNPTRGSSEPVSI